MDFSPMLTFLLLALIYTAIGFLGGVVGLLIYRGIKCIYNCVCTACCSPAKAKAKRVSRRDRR